MQTKPVECFRRGNWVVGVIFGEFEKRFKWSCGDWFAVVNFDRMDAAKQSLHDDANDDAGVKELLTQDADCGGIFDCSDEAVAIKAGLISTEPEDAETLDIESYRAERSLRYEYAKASGVY